MAYLQNFPVEFIKASFHGYTTNRVARKLTINQAKLLRERPGLITSSGGNRNICRCC